MASRGETLEARVETTTDADELARTLAALAKEWVRYEGPRGGEGWLNTETREVRYVGAPPDDGGPVTDDETQTSFGDEWIEEPSFDTPRWATVERIQGKLDLLGGSIIDHDDVSEIHWRAYDIAAENAGFKRAPTPAEYVQSIEDFVVENGDETVASKVGDALGSLDTNSPWGDTGAPDHLNPETFDKTEGMYEVFDGVTGISAASMFVSYNEDSPDYGRLFVTNLDQNITNDQDFTAETEESGERVSAAYEFLRFTGPDGLTPDHHYEPGAYYAVEESDGFALEEERIDEWEAESYQEELVYTAAYGLLSGNSDMHDQNIFSTWDGMTIIDNDLGGSNFVENDHMASHALSQLNMPAFDVRAVSDPYGDGDDAAEFHRRVIEEAEHMAENIDTDALREHFAERGVESEFADNIIANVEGAKSGRWFSKQKEQWGHEEVAA